MSCLDKNYYKHYVKHLLNMIWCNEAMVSKLLEHVRIVLRILSLVNLFNLDLTKNRKIYIWVREKTKVTDVNEVDVGRAR